MDAIYLRKSRVDLEAERSGAGNTLSRHRQTLTDLAKRQDRQIGEIYEEICSGDSIASRPEMQRLLHDVEAGRWDSILVMEIERLARGDSIDQGVVAQAFKYSGTKIVTPMKIYDPQNEFDEEFFEFGLFMSRREYKTIKRRLQAGQLAAVKEGRYMGKTAPLGYRRVRVENGKGWTLEIVPETAAHVQHIFQLALQGYGLQKIARTLNAEGIPSAQGKTWSEFTVRTILDNVVYRGDVSWGKRPSVKTSTGGVVSKTRPCSDTYLICEGLHEPIVTREIFAAAQEQRRRFPAPPVHQNAALHNPFQGLLYCRLCGQRLQLCLKSSTGKRSFVCRNLACDNISATQEVVEHAVHDALVRWTREYSFSLDHADAADLEQERASIQTRCDQIAAQLQQQNQRMSRAYDMLELGVYQPEEFQIRRAELQKQNAALQDSYRDAAQSMQKLQDILDARSTIVPRITHITDVWDSLHTPEEKNTLLRSCIERLEYQKTGKRSQSQIKVWVYPVLPDQ